MVNGKQLKDMDLSSNRLNYYNKDRQIKNCILKLYLQSCSMGTTIKDPTNQTKPSFAPAESWLRQTARDHIEANDCDGSALLAVGVLTATTGITKEQEKEYKNLRAIRNVIYPHYSVGVSIVGASAAEATSADGAHTNVAGHAIALLMPNLHLLRALSRSAHLELAKTGVHVIDENRREQVANARFDAFFPKDVVEKLTEYDRNNLGSWEDA